MPVETATSWGVLAGMGLLLVGGLLAAAFDGVLRARIAGAATSSGLLTPVAETARLLRQRRRTTLAADRPLWRIGAAGLVVVPLLMVAVIPLGGRVLFDSEVGVVWFNTADVIVWPWSGCSAGEPTRSIR